MVARLAAAVGAVLTIVGIFLDFWLDTSYWDYDGTIAWVGLVLGAGALLLVAAGLAGRAPVGGWLFAVGAFLVGYWAWFPAVTAVDDWENTDVGAWLCLGGAGLVAAGAAALLTG